MIYAHQQQAIDFIINKFKMDTQVDALLLTGSIIHGFNDEHSDVDLCIIVSSENYEERKKNNDVTY